jgi:hypothetical protein
LREVVCPILKLREEKWTFVMVGGGKIDFFLKKNYYCRYWQRNQQQQRLTLIGISEQIK